MRFYEDAGLLPAARNPAGYRHYGDDAVERLAFISSAKLLGPVLEEIRELLDVRENGACAPVRARLRSLVADRVGRANRRVADVHAALSGDAPPGACGPACGCTTTPPVAPPRSSTPLNPFPTPGGRFRWRARSAVPRSASASGSGVRWSTGSRAAKTSRTGSAPESGAGLLADLFGTTGGRPGPPGRMAGGL
ncbi:MerR family transcriptional regulator [Actinosynnema sp. NPDC047251]|uniref:HTH merR-type domain-containing protein n=1 Tax=Saccharothrix espanaensis (strain ATCC 51144 / DSM 44229 / JCM 9112 / NBRC 15066 / NRRL 15764) TaxID=1179773 RepID=K0K0S3_SACES|nr:MerR family transcriptional regulator [Saccharothrix espanaensis]CCH30148.1 hypothetical protein BN6_28370 [Saccharothrix espanaensis DSM 44229]